MVDVWTLAEAESDGRVLPSGVHFGVHDDDGHDGRRPPLVPAGRDGPLRLPLGLQPHRSAHTGRPADVDRPGPAFRTDAAAAASALRPPLLRRLDPPLERRRPPPTTPAVQVRLNDRQRRRLPASFKRDFLRVVLSVLQSYLIPIHSYRMSKYIWASIFV